MQLTLDGGASVAEVARAHGVNANQVFKWRREFERGDLVEPSSALLPVSVVSLDEAMEEQAPAERERSEASGSIHVELPGRAVISIERGADAAMVRKILETLQR